MDRRKSRRTTRSRYTRSPSPTMHDIKKSRAGGQSPSPTRVLMPAIVNPSRKSTCQGMETASPGPRSSTFRPPDITGPTRKSTHDESEMHRPRRHVGPSNGVVAGSAWTGRTSPYPRVASIRPVYPGPQVPRKIQQLGIGPARQFLEVMRNVPQTPQGNRPQMHSDRVQVKSFPFEPVEA